MSHSDAATPTPQQRPHARLMLAVLAAMMLMWQGVQHIRIIRFFYPLDYRENTAFYRALLVAAGRNLYDFHSLPYSHSQYGFVNDYVAAPFAMLLGPSLSAVRIVSAIAIFLTALLLSTYAWRKTGDWLVSFAVFTLVYVSSFSHPGIFLGFPNALGAFFFVASLVAPLLGSFSVLALGIGGLAGLLGFFTKIYFGAGPAFVLAYLLVSRRWGKAAGYALAGTVALGGALWAVNVTFPDYFATTITLVGTLPKWDGTWLAVQTIYFLVLQAPLLVFLVWRFWHLPQSGRMGLVLGFSGVGTFVALAALCKMGGNPLQYYLYFYDLLFPFLLLLALDCVGQTVQARYNLLICLIANTALMLVLTLQHVPLWRVADSFHAIEARFPKGGLNNVLLDAPANFYVIRQGQTPLDQGQTEFLLGTRGEPYNLYMAELAGIEARKKAGAYSLVITDDWQVNRNHADLQRCYVQSGRQDLWFYQLSIPGQIWTRKAC